MAIPAASLSGMMRILVFPEISFFRWFHQQSVEPSAKSKGFQIPLSKRVTVRFGKLRQLFLLD